MHNYTISEIVCILTALANTCAGGFYAGRLAQLIRDTKERVDKIEAVTLGEPPTWHEDTVARVARLEAWVDAQRVAA